MTAQDLKEQLRPLIAGLLQDGETPAGIKATVQGFINAARIENILFVGSEFHPDRVPVVESIVDELIAEAA